MDENVSETKNSTMELSSLPMLSLPSIPASTEKLNSLTQECDTLFHQSNALNFATGQMNAYREILDSKTISDTMNMEQDVTELAQLGKGFEEIGPLLKVDIQKTLDWLFRKIAWQPKKQTSSNNGYVGYEDMLLRYRDLKKELNKMQIMNNQTSNMRNHVINEKRQMRQMNEKLEEIRHRLVLLHVSSTIASRTLDENDSLATLFFLPIVLPGIIYHADTSEGYASALLHLSKKILAVAEAVQYERTPLNDAVVTASKVLAHPPQFAVSSLFAPVQYAEGNGEVSAPEERIIPIARDSAHTLIATENGEVFAPEEKIIPIARDSALTLVASENGEVTATSEINMPVAKDSATTLGSEESPKPLSRTQIMSRADVKTSTHSIKSQKKG